MRTAPVALLAASALLALTVTCADDDPAGAAASSSSGTGGAGGEGAIVVTVSSGGPPPPDAELCGNEVHDVELDAPAIYFVLDASGSMLEREGGGTRYDALRDTVVDLVARTGSRARVGAAIFPHEASDFEPCRPGDEVFPVTPGDPVGAPGELGPTTAALAAAIDVEPLGGTPTAITLEAVGRALESVPGRREVILVTDGGPNCNATSSCGPDACIVNMEGACPAAFDNCCDPFEGGTVQNCLDRARTLAAVSALREAGSPVHVVGVSGSGPFAGILGQMAILGGAPTAGPPYYHDAEDVAALAEALSSIAQVVGSCVFELDDPPPETWRTNVWLDADRLPYDPVNGWMWRGAPLDYVPEEPPPTAGSSSSTASAGGSGGAGGAGGSGGAAGMGGAGAQGGAGGEGGGPEVDTSAVELRGESCRRFSAGEVQRVQIVTGCPTTIPN